MGFPLQKYIVIWTTIIVYGIFMLVIGIVNSKSSKSVASFTVGSRNAGAWLSALSYGTAYFSAVMFIGYAGTSGWKYGLWAILIGLGNAVFGSWLAWKVLALRTREVSHRLKIKSMPQLFSLRFASEKMKVFATVVIFIFLMPYSASVYKGLGSVCAVLLGIDVKVCMIVIMVAAAIVLVVGGYLATLKADFFQGFIMMIGVALLIVFVMKSPTVVEGGSIAGMWDFMKANKLAPLSSSDTIALIATILMTSFGTWGLPQMIHKYYGIRDVKEVKRGTIISTVFALLVSVGGYFIGSFSHLFFTGLPEGGADYLIPNMLNASALPNILLGVVLVLLISSSVSTLSSITLTACSSASMDLIKPKFLPRLNNRGIAVLTRVLCLLFVVLSYVIANTDTPILDMMSYSWGIISGSFLAPYVLSLYCKSLNRAGAWTGMLGGFLIALIPAVSKILLIILGNPTDTTGFVGQLNSFAAQGPVYAVAAMIASFALCLIGSKVAASLKLKAAEQDDFFYTGTIAEE